MWRSQKLHPSAVATQTINYIDYLQSSRFNTTTIIIQMCYLLNVHILVSDLMDQNFNSCLPFVWRRISLVFQSRFINRWYSVTVSKSPV